MTKVRKNLVGKRFGRLTVLAISAVQDAAHTKYLCRCDCGTEKNIQGVCLVSGHTKSCGCWHDESAYLRGIKRSNWTNKNFPLYRVWYHMIDRCENIKHKNFYNYGGRGITVCEQWHDVDSFCSWALSSGYRLGLQIDRIDNNLGYFPENCRWVTPVVQQNNKRTVRLVDGKTIRTWAEGHCDARWLSTKRIMKTILARLLAGWDEALAVTLSVDKDRNIVAEFLDTYSPALTAKVFPVREGVSC